MSKSDPDGKDGVERRRAKRRAIFETFSLFAVIPKKGAHRLAIHDVSDHGMRFDLDVEGESPSDFPVRTGETLQLRLYLNPSLYLPLEIRVVRIEERPQQRRVGGEFTGRESRGQQGYEAFLAMLDRVTEIAKIDSEA